MRLPRIQQLLMVVVAGMLVLPAGAVDPPRPTIAEAMGLGQTAFLAHAVKIELVALHKFDASAKMILQIDRCYYGISCRERQLKMTYVSQTFADAAFGVHFLVGQEILFILHERPDVTKHYPFNSAFHGGIDLAFRGPMLPPYVGMEEPAFESIYTYKAEIISYEKLQELGEKRKGELEAANH
jgi:hypothetical protein